MKAASRRFFRIAYSHSVDGMLSLCCWAASQTLGPAGSSIVKLPSMPAILFRRAFFLGFCLSSNLHQNSSELRRIKPTSHTRPSQTRMSKPD